MDSAPRLIDGAEVFYSTPIDSRHHFTEKCRHFVAGALVGPVPGLAICQYDGSDEYYLFRCDSDWKCVTDTCHSTKHSRRQSLNMRVRHRPGSSAYESARAL
jgi:hypothetical protein